MDKKMLDVALLKETINRKLPPGYSVAMSAGYRGLLVDVYDGDVLIMSVPIDGLSTGEAVQKVMTAFGDSYAN